MCGIVGLLIKPKPLRKQLGRLMVPMFNSMGARGPDSGGCAFFHEPTPASQRRISLLVSDRAYDWPSFEAGLRSTFSETGDTASQLESTENHAVLTTTISPAEIQAWLSAEEPALRVLSVGRSIEVFKDIGHPSEIAERYHFSEVSASHCVGHTRMATESAVTPEHSHPFTAGEDFCLVHNGSLSNPYMLRRKLEREGLKFETDNDTEAACRYLQWRMQQGEDLSIALEHAFEELDGFYTLLMATEDRLSLVRDAFACKPAVVAETDDYVAISSEYRSLAHLPDADQAEIFEPQPEEIYSWAV
ncbi:MAG: amidophosphoribosyltransferase [Planctomycetes bacterium]|nr:amidophosphoribosyltransferase [Planctomycetota bacterium]